MKIKHVVLTLTLLLSVLNTFSQEGFYLKDYNWEKKPKSFELNKKELEQSQITLFEKKVYQLIMGDEGNYVNCVLEHKIIRLNNDQAIERNNKFYVSNYGSINVFQQKARAINPDGKITELSASDVKVFYDEEGDPQYQYFAFEGIEVGSVIEYFHIMTFPIEYSGREVKVQSSFDKKDVNYELVCPSHLEFKMKSVNGIGEFVKDTITSGETRYSIHLDYLKGIEDEPSSAYNAELGKFYYMLHKNLYSGKSNFYNYQDVTKNIYSIWYTTPNKKELKAIQKFIASSGAQKGKDTREKIFLLEKYLKDVLVITDISFEGSFDLVNILKTNLSSEAGATKLMLHCLKQLDIDFELVITCDRYENRFMDDFQGYNFLEKFLIYVNELDGYWMSEKTTRFGFPDYQYVFNKGLFIKEIELNGLVSSLGEIKNIKGKPVTESIDEMKIKVSINEDMTKTNIHLDRSSSGYKAFHQCIIDFIAGEQKEEFMESYINYLDDETKPTNVTFKNDSTCYYGYKPLIGSGDLESENFIEKAGDKYLFKVGMLIGPQSDLYNENERLLPVELENLRKYIREIRFEIPEGYEVVNLEELEMNIVSKNDSKEMGFVSNYKIESNTLVVNIEEWYNVIHLPIERYKEYENVVNAAANFNKIKLVLKQK
jgi:hypothetical protein